MLFEHDRDRFPYWTELDRITDEVRQHLLEAQRIDVRNQRHRSRHRNDLSTGTFESTHGRSNKFGKVGPLLEESESLALDLNGFQGAIDEPRKLFDLLIDQLQGSRLCRIEV